MTAEKVKTWFLTVAPHVLAEFPLSPRQSLSRTARILAGDRLSGNFYRVRGDESDAASLCDYSRQASPAALQNMP